MKKLSFLAVCGLMSLASCTHHDMDYDMAQEIKENAEGIFGLIDPKQDWSNITSGTVTVTANADLTDIAKVQILTESPFLNKDAKILSEADATSGQTVTLSYDAPKGTETLIASCVDSKGHHFIKPFSVGTSSVSFTTSQKARSTTRAGVDLNASGLTLEAATAQKSFNALRTVYANLAKQTNDSYMVNASKNKNLYLWEGSNWEDEMLWQLASSNNAGGTWSVVNGTVVRSTSAIDAEEKATLKAIFDGFLPNKDGVTYKKQHDNMAAIREGSAVKFFNNHLTSTGNPISIIPVQMSSTDLNKCELYYYYYKPENVPSGMSETDYIKQLPKFKAISCDYTKSASGVKEAEFFKVHEYLLPYYGDNSLTTPVECTTDGKVYRIRNGAIHKDQTFYMTYVGGDEYNSEKMRTLYSDDNQALANQLWQIFTTSTGKTLLYNIGGKKFLTGVGSYIADSNNWGTFFTDQLSVVKELAYEMEDGDNGCKHLWYNSVHTEALGSNVGKHNLRIATNKTTDNGAQIDWYFDEYNGSARKLESLSLEGDPKNNTCVSETIPKGYRVGFMLRKVNVQREGKTLQAYINTVNNGCVYGDGDLNTVINNFPGHFGESKSVYSMEDNDPRIAMFNANNKTYLAFEDGNDCNYSDMIVEVVGDSGSSIDDIPDLDGQRFTMCFEDRPNIADYDMNDVVLSCERKSEDELTLTLLATGAYDKVLICGIAGQLTSGTELNNQEVHQLFGVAEETFVNTEPSQPLLPSISATYKVDKSLTIAQFLSDIYIKNLTTGGIEVRIPAQGEAPFALILPQDFNYPAERVSIISAYPLFKQWANDSSQYNQWTNLYEDNKIYKNPLLR